MLWCASAALACLVERYIGYPSGLQKVFAHPVQWIGALLEWLELTLNTMPHEKTEGRLRGALALVLLLLATVLPAYLLQDIVSRSPYGWVLTALLATPLIAQKSMRDHVMDVVNALGVSVQAARSAVAMIVGRDTSQLNESGVAKAALESLAENTADGIVAPVFWFAVLGLPGIVAYKAINTADSMIGHFSQRYQHFGYCAAKLDDIVNLPASRLSALLFAAAAAIDGRQRGEDALKAAWRDAGKHRSPNAGWPEAAVAGALQLKFGGPRSYGSETVDLAWMGNGRETMNRADIRSGLKLYDRSLWAMLALLTVLALIP